MQSISVLLHYDMTKLAEDPLQKPQKFLWNYEKQTVELCLASV